MEKQWKERGYVVLNVNDEGKTDHVLTWEGYTVWTFAGDEAKAAISARDDFNRALESAGVLAAWLEVVDTDHIPKDLRAELRDHRAENYSYTEKESLLRSFLLTAEEELARICRESGVKFSKFRSVHWQFSPEWKLRYAREFNSTNPANFELLSQPHERKMDLDRLIDLAENLAWIKQKFVQIIHEETKKLDDAIDTVEDFCMSHDLSPFQSLQTKESKEQ